MFKKLLAAAVLLVANAWGQTVQTPTLSRNNTWTGNNTFNGSLTAGAGTFKSVNQAIDLVGSGCAGDGSTDDEGCITTVLTAAGLLSHQVTVNITDNHVFLIGTNPGGTQVFTLPPNVSFTGKGTIKIGNSFGVYQALFRFSGTPTNTTFRDFTIDGNASNNPVNTDPVAGNNGRVAFLGSLGINVTFENAHFINGNDVQTIDLNTCDDCKVIGNTWYNYGIGGTFDHDSSEIYLHPHLGHGGLVAFNNFNAAGLGVRTAIEVHGDNVAVTNNTINSYRYCVIVSPQDIPSDHNYVIAENTCNNVYRGIDLFATTGAYDGLDVTGNTIVINRSGFWTVDNSEGAVVFEVTNTFGISNANISNNIIKEIPDALIAGALTAAIRIATTNSSFPFTITNLKISDNSITNSLCQAIYVANWAPVVGLVIQGNQITNPGTNTNVSTTCFGTAFKTGITLNEGGTSSYQSSVVANNIISDNQASPTMQVGIRLLGLAGDNAQTGLVLRDNTITYTGSPANASASYLDINVSCPELHGRIPNFNRSDAWMNSMAANQFCVKGSTIYDPISGRLYTQTAASTSTAFLSTEFGSSAPASGNYSVGDKIFNPAPTATGTCFWVNTTAGTPGTFTASACGAPTVVGSGTAAMTTAAIAAGACGTTVTVAATGVATTDSIIHAFNAAPLVNPGELVISAWPTSGNVNFQYCNPTAGSITPAAATLNWRVVR